MYYVSVAASHPCGLPFSSVDLPDTSVPVCSFSVLTLVHLVSLLQLPLFQIKLFDYPAQAAAA